MCIRDKEIDVDRRYDDTDGDGALGRRARPTWSVLTLIGAIIAAAAAVLAAEHAVATSAAQIVVRPVEKRIDDHLAQMLPTQRLMEQYVSEQRSFNAEAAGALDALCRATPAARCPLRKR
jgi:hypothetical protein